jgi:ABC-type branched-subunit amino acid transport system permease subunit
MRDPRYLISYAILLSLPPIFEILGIARLTSILAYSYIMSIYALSFALLLGYLGLLNFGHALFFGIGAYVTTYQILWAGVPYPLAMLASMLIGGLAGAGAAFISRKAFRGIPFAFITLTLLLIVYFLYKRRELRAISGSEQGLLVPTPQMFVSPLIPIMASLIIIAYMVVILIESRHRGIVASGTSRVSGTYLSRNNVTWLSAAALILSVSTYILTIGQMSKPEPYRVSANLYIVALITLYLVHMAIKMITETPVALIWIAIRDSEARAETMGYSSFSYKTLGLVIAGCFASLSGSLYISYSSNINPERAFNPILSIYGLIYSIIGGLYPIEGPILGAILVSIIENFLADYMGGWSLVIIGVAFIVIIWLLPNGLAFYLWRARVGVIKGITRRIAKIKSRE